MNPHFPPSDPGLEEGARTDQLTGLPNRRHLEESLVREVALAQRQQRPLSIAILDVDRFKLLNETHGHQAGDAVLAAVARLIHTKLRTSDTAARYGGEEFAILLPFTDEHGARIASERLREAIDDLRVPWRGMHLRVTASLGGTSLETVGALVPEVAERALRAADDELYRAKREGRNRVCWTRLGVPD